MKKKRTEKKYRKFKRKIRKINYFDFYEYFFHLRSRRYTLVKKLKNINLIKNYIVDNYIFNDFKIYFPLKEYLINNTYLDYHDPKFDDDDMFYYVFICLFKLDKQANKFLKALHNGEINGFITKVNVKYYIKCVYTYLHYFEKIDKYLFFDKGPSFLINKNKDLTFYEKAGDKVLKHAITYINSETEIEYDYFFIGLYIIPMILLLLFYTKHLHSLKNKSGNFMSIMMMEGKFNILMSNNIFYILKTYLELISRYYISNEFRAFNKIFITELDYLHRSKAKSKADREIVVNSIYEYMFNYKYNYYYVPKYKAYPGSYYIILGNNIALMFLIYTLVYLYIDKNVYKYYKSKFYQYIQLANYYNQLNSVFNRKDIDNINYYEYKYLMIIYLYYAINKSNIYLHYLSEIKNKIKKKNDCK